MASSNTNASDSYSWIKGTYNIRVKAKDIRGLESEGSDPFPITMPRDKATSNVLLMRLLEWFPLLEKLLLKTQVYGYHPPYIG